ncbi:cysteine-rich receptor-like protein kinase 26 [Impatiens glandulifera]|uniref:cysteine-rich receptor-like protein kinase 26 n=1 Tax=Impatiens glandulifera TaxID=253017 RepID=UPI001FB0D4A0|nr:cysteine-rich receptor-like protein kinase 26 [Impatiens glandulifera]
MTSHLLQYLFLLFLIIGLAGAALGPNTGIMSCPENETISSEYRSNIDKLFSSLLMNGDFVIGFSNSSFGTGEVVYGLFLCRGDVNSSTCSKCVSTANSGLLNVCRRQSNKAGAWYDDCMLRYSNETTFSKLDQSVNRLVMGWMDLSNSTRLMEVLGQDKLNDVINRAANGGSLKKYAVGEADFNSTKKVTVYGQCTPDISASDCQTCLRTANASLEGGVGIYYPSCVLSFDLEDIVLSGGGGVDISTKRSVAIIFTILLVFAGQI